MMMDLTFSTARAQELCRLGPSGLAAFRDACVTPTREFSYYSTTVRATPRNAFTSQQIILTHDSCHLARGYPPVHPQCGAIGAANLLLLWLRALPTGS